MNRIIPPQEYSVELGPAPLPLVWLPQLLGFLRRGWLTILAAALVTLGAAAGYLLHATPRFTATASLLVDLRRADQYRQQAVLSVDAQYESAMVESQVEILRSETIADHVVRKLHLDTDAEFLSWNRGLMVTVSRVLGALFDSDSGPAPAASSEAMLRRAQAAEALSRLIQVRRVGLSYVVAVSARTPDATRSAQLANAVVQALIETQLESKYDTIRRASGWLETRLGELREQSLAADRAVQEFKAQNGIVDTEKGLMDEHQLSDLSTQLVQARTRAADAAAKLARIQQINDGGFADAQVSDALQNVVITRLRQDYLDAARRAADWSARYGANHGAAVNLRNQMREIQNSIRTELERIAGAYRSDYEVAKENEAGVQRRLNEMVASASATNSERVRLRSLESMADAYRSVQSAFLQRYAQATQDQSFPIAETRIVTEAMPPLRKSWPQPLIVLGAGAIAGTLLGAALAFAREVLDRGLRTPAQVQASLGLDCVSVLPRLARRDIAARARRRQAAPAQAGAQASAAGARAMSTGEPALRWVVDAPFAPFTEGMRGIRARVLRRRGRTRDTSVIACISATAGEGKSTVAANLAYLMAGAGQRTLLVDWDLRQLTLSRALAPAARTGFQDLALSLPECEQDASEVVGHVAREGAEAGRQFLTDPDTGLCFMPAGGSFRQQPGVELLGSERTRTLMASLRQEFDWIVLDLPPLDATADVHAVADLVDSFLVVVAWGKTPQDAVLDALARADLEPHRMLGVVLNKAEPGAAGKLSSYNVGAYGRAVA